jgi:hypothetical protein
MWTTEAAIINLLMTKTLPKLRLVTIDPKYAIIYITPAKAMLKAYPLFGLMKLLALIK